MIARRFIHKQDLPEGSFARAIAGTLFLSRSLTRRRRRLPMRRSCRNYAFFIRKRCHTRHGRDGFRAACRHRNSWLTFSGSSGPCIRPCHLRSSAVHRRQQFCRSRRYRSTPKYSCAPPRARRKPVTTSSKINRTSLSSQASKTRQKNVARQDDPLQRLNDDGGQVIAMLFDDPTNGIKIVVRRYQQCPPCYQPTGAGRPVAV